MRPFALFALSCLCAGWATAQVTAALNGGFEESANGLCTNWRSYGAYVIDRGVKHGGGQSIRCELSPERNISGVMQEITFVDPNTEPIVFGGWSRAENVRSFDYCIYLDIWYTDGSNTWGVRANWKDITHDWQRVIQAFSPRKPIKKIQMFVFLRNGDTGRAWFDDIFLERRKPGLDIVTVGQRTDFPHSRRKIVTAEFLAPCDWSVMGASPAKGRGASAKVLMDGAATGLAFALADGASRTNVTYSLRPIELPASPVQHGVAVWTADSMRRVSPLTYPTAAELAAEKAIRLELARNEHESAQIQLTAANDAGWEEGSVALSPLRDAKGNVFKGSLTWERIGYLAREDGARAHPDMLPDVETWTPDPLLPAGPFRVPAGGTQGIWLTAFAAPDAVPGEYSGEAVLSERGKEQARVRLAVRVRSFAQPQFFGMKTAFSVMDGFTRATYPAKFAAMKRESHGILLDNRLNPDDISRTEPPELEDLVAERARGMSSFNILNIVPKPKDPNALWVCYANPEDVFAPQFYGSFKARLAPYWAELRRLGLDKLAYVYGFDERQHDYYEGIDTFWKNLRRDFPGLPVMTTAMMYRDLSSGQTNFPCLTTTDWFCPLTSVYQPALSASLRSQGKQVWWYVCCDPHYPYANFASLEYPLIEGRLLGWMGHRFRSDGLLYWHVNLWNGQPLLDERETYFPAWRTGNGLRMPGDGILLYPGREHVLSSIRLAQIRDGVEDYEWLQLAASRHGAAAADALSARLITDMTHFNRSPAALRETRARLADLIEKAP
jgi:hypothetical protein